MNTAIAQKTEELIQLIKATEDYKAYQISLHKVEEHPGLKDRLDAFRARTFHMHQDKNVDLFEETDRIAKEHEELCRIPEVNQFLDAELALCRLLKETENRVSEEIHLQVPEI